jgi:hypothetical protein
LFVLKKNYIYLNIVINKDFTPPLMTLGGLYPPCLSSAIVLTKKNPKIMVRVIAYHENINLAGEKFYSLSIQGGIEMVKSKESGNFYATARKARITTTFDELTCESLIGESLTGSIQKVECDAYEYTVPESGEVITMHHTFTYLPDELQSAEAAVLAD